MKWIRTNMVWFLAAILIVGLGIETYRYADSQYWKAVKDMNTYITCREYLPFTDEIMTMKENDVYHCRDLALILDNTRHDRLVEDAGEQGSD
jgi:hypothetical protein